MKYEKKKYMENQLCEIKIICNVFQYISKDIQYGVHKLKKLFDNGF